MMATRFKPPSWLTARQRDLFSEVVRLANAATEARDQNLAPVDCYALSHLTTLLDLWASGGSDPRMDSTLERAGARFYLTDEWLSTLRDHAAALVLREGLE